MTAHLQEKHKKNNLAKNYTLRKIFIIVRDYYIEYTKKVLFAFVYKSIS